MRTANICFWILVTMASIVPGLFDPAPVEAEIAADFFPLESGLKWTYRVDGTGSYTVTVSAGTEFVNGIPTKVLLLTGGEYTGSKLNLTNDSNGIRQHKEYTPSVYLPGSGYRNLTMVYSPPLKFVDADVNLGDTVNGSGDVSLTISGLGTFLLNYTNTSKIEALENVTVPFGSFVAVKMQQSLTIYGYIPGQYGDQYVSISSDSTTWLAKYIGEIKAIDITEGILTTEELTGINFQPHLAADFSGDQTTGFVPFTVNFTDLTDGNVSSWSWNFGDGGTSTVQNPSHTYSNPGSYTVSLTVSGAGNSDTETKTNYITANYPPPAAGFSVGQTTGIAPFTVNFTDLSAGSITSWSWNFGDNGTSTVQNPSHTYNNPGSYTVSLTVAGPGGSDTETRANYIDVNYPPPTADYSAVQTSGIAPLNVNFTDLSDGEITSWSWDFGDGGTSVDQNPSHTYNDPGRYTVSLTVAGPGGSDTETREAYINLALAGGDVNSDNIVDLGDLILVLQVLAQIQPDPALSKISDINGDARTGLEEAIYILQFISGL